MQPSLADRAVIDSYKVVQLANGRARKELDAANLQFRIDLRKANRFELDNDFVRLATQVASTQPGALLSRVGIATLPYETTWIEFDLHAKVSQSIAQGTAQYPTLDNVPYRLGLLLKRHPRRASCWTMTVVSELKMFEHHLVTINPAAFTFDADELDFKLLNDDGILSLKGDNTAFHDVAALAWGFYNAEHSPIRAAAFRELARHGSPTIHPSFHGIADRGIRSKDMNRVREIAAELTKNAKENAGLLRWMVTVLAMLNEVPVISNHVQPTGLQRVRLNTKRPLLDFHRLTLRVPKTKALPWIERKLSHSERRHKAHEVRSHWRSYPPKKPPGCKEHQWLYDHEHGYRLCEICESFSRNIPEHVRGDPSLGWVRKDYVVKKEQSYELP
jgi:hypothetical protein